MIPTLWLKENDKYSFWPRKDIRNCIIKCKKPQNDWVLYPVTVLAKYGMYYNFIYLIKSLIYLVNYTYNILILSWKNLIIFRFIRTCSTEGEKIDGRKKHSTESESQLDRGYRKKRFHVTFQKKMV